MISLKKQLIIGVLGLFTVVGLLAGGISYWLAQKDAGTLLDHQLFLIAGSLHEGTQLPEMQERFLEESPEQQKMGFVIQVWNTGIPVRVSRPDFDLPPGAATGYSYLDMRGERWRAYTIVYSDRIVQVSQADEVRREIASNAALRALLPVAILFPLSWLLIVSGVGRILKPLDAVARAATQRDASSLSPLPVESVPQEIVPLVIEMNGLIQRVGKTLDSQRHFVLDAAHELRTPLAALQLQIENLSQSSSAEDREVRVNDLKSGIQRATHLVSQLLHMARYDAEKLNTRTTVNLGELVKSCLADFIPIAEARKIDLGMVRDDAANIWANADDLRILFCNLLDNAIRYTHVGGKIDIGVIASGQEVVVEIGDTGPGIPEHLLSRVFDRFFRVEGNDAEGSGIGLAIVSAIASRENAEVILVNSLERSGLVAKVTFQCVVPA